MLFDYIAAWCTNAAQQVTIAKQSLAACSERREEAAQVLQAFLERAQADPDFADQGSVRQGVAATLREFEATATKHFSIENFSSYKRVESVLEEFRGPADDEWAPAASDVNLEVELEALATQIAELHQETSNSGSRAINDSSEHSLRALLEMSRTAPAGSRTRGELSPFYVPKEKRAGRLKAAAWTIGILFLVSAAQAAFIIVLLGAIAVFVAQLVITGRTDDDERTANQDMAAYEARLKERVRDLNHLASVVMEKLLHDTEQKLDDAAKGASKACASILATARAATQKAVPDLSFIFGECAVTPLVQHMVRHPDAGFLVYAIASHALEDFVEDPETIGQCLAHLPLSECDEIEILVDGEVDAGSVGTAIAAAALAGSKPGLARFMFVEPGRLAEAYRVFGSLNESAATRLAERLYITHVNELASAVDALRTFVGRTKEAMTRRADKGQRIFDGEAANDSISLQRAVVVLDRTQSYHWPEKDKRRLSEFFDELGALCRVGAREGSVLLIELKALPGDPKIHRPSTTERTLRLRAQPEGLMFEGNILALYPPRKSAAEIGAECDAWVKDAKKADSSLRQVGATLDWSDAKVSDTRYGIEVDIGRHGADRPAKLLLGREGAHHAICIGRTGSGKTNLFHVMISNLVRRYSPEELELYLLDFKEGVEFAVYADLALPHCRAVAIDADRGFGLSVLTHLKRELNRRAGIFKAAGVGIASLERYEEVTRKNMPRIVLLIDEFQVLLQAGERVAGAAPGAAAAALEDLVRRGRSFGLHVILGSQTLAGRELTAATLGQLAVRIVLPCSAPDAAMLLGERPISGQLRAPGDAIVWRAGQGEVSDAHLAKIYAAELDDLPTLAETSKQQAEREGRPAPAPFVFRGSGQNELGEVMPHLQAVKRDRNEPSASIFALGAPTSYGERPAGVFRNSRGRNLLFVHRADETRAEFLYSALESALLLDPLFRVVLCDLEESKDFSGNVIAERLRAEFDSRVVLVEMGSLEDEIGALAGALDNPFPVRTVLAIAGSARTNLSRSAAFATVLRNGPEAGLHSIVTCDTVKNLERLIDRSSVTEFGIRSLGPASAGDSQRLLDATDAETLTADHHYLVLDDSVSGRLTRLQVLTPMMPEVEAAPTLIAEATSV